MDKAHGGIKQHPTPIKKEENYFGKFHDPENTKMVKIREKQDLSWEGNLSPDA